MYINRKKLCEEEASNILCLNIALRSSNKWRQFSALLLGLSAVNRNGINDFRKNQKQCIQTVLCVCKRYQDRGCPFRTGAFIKKFHGYKLWTCINNFQYFDVAFLFLGIFCGLYCQNILEGNSLQQRQVPVKVCLWHLRNRKIKK